MSALADAARDYLQLRNSLGPPWTKPKRSPNPPILSRP